MIWGRLIDGGYYENSGIATIDDVTDAFLNAVDYLRVETPTWVRPEIIVVVISNDPAPQQYSSHSAEPSRPSERPIEPPREVLINYQLRNQLSELLSQTDAWSSSIELSEVLSPVEGLLATRNGRAASERRTLARRIDELRLLERIRCADEIFRASNTPTGEKLRFAKMLMADITGDRERLDTCTPIRGYEEISLARFLSDSRTDEVIDTGKANSALNNPGLGWFLSKGSRETMNVLAPKLRTNVSLGESDYDSIALKALKLYYDKPQQTEEQEPSKIESKSDLPDIPFTHCRDGFTNRNPAGDLLATASNGNVAEVACLIRHHAQIDFQDPFGDTPLYYATAFNHRDVMALLLKHGANPNGVGQGTPPLLRAMQESDVPAFELLVKYKANVNQQSSDRRTLLMVAADSCNEKMAAVKPHTWHMEMIGSLCAADAEILLVSPFQVVDLEDEQNSANAVAWWMDMTSRGGEGMVVKPLNFVAEGRRGVTQPAIKCRGPEYLRIIYGPE